MLEAINSYLSGIVVPFLLIAVGVFYCARLRCFHLLRPLAVVRSLGLGKKSGASSARAMMLALAGTLGVGNIIGVSSAIYLGGAGAVFWMWASALVAMLLKYAEIVLAMKHKSDNDAGGCAMLYIKRAFAAVGFGRLGGILAAVFAALFLLTSLTMGSMLQSSAIAEALEGVIGLPRIAVGIAVATVIFFALASGTRGISSITNALVPVMSAGYIVMSLAVIFIGRAHLADAFLAIFRGAFTPVSAASGIGGFIFTRAMRYGIMRGLISNEAGCGTAPTAHAIADCPSPARQGLWGIVEVFVDTVVLCTMTALVVLIGYTDAALYGGNYMMMSIAAFESGLGSYAAYFLCVAVVCFGLATILCWAHYGNACVRYFSKTARSLRLFRLLYCSAVLVGALASADLAWLLSDLAMGAMTVINLSCLIILNKQVKQETDLLF